MKLPTLRTTAIAVSLTLSSASTFAMDSFGYARAGSSTTSSGGEAHCFKDSTDDAHYAGRLGDECDSYAEIGLGHTVQVNGGPRVRFETMFSAQANYQGNDYQSLTSPTDKTGRGDWALRQLNAQADNVLASAPDALFWVGKRYYQRRDVHLLDLYYLNNSGNGAGIEKIPAGPGKIAFAWMTGDHKPTAGKIDANSEQTVQTVKWDLRYQDLPVSSLGTVDFAAIFGKSDRTSIQKAANESNATGSQHTIEFKHSLGAAKNVAVLQYGTNALADAVFSNVTGTRVDTYTEWQGDSKNSTRFIYHGSAPVLSNIEVAYSLLYATAKTYSANVPQQKPTRLSLVVRPTYFWNDANRTTVELGFTRSQLSNEFEKSNLQKIVVAQEIAPKIGLMARPVLRLYAGSFFGDKADAVRTGNADGESGNVRIGAQFEAWW